MTSTESLNEKIATTPAVRSEDETDAAMAAWKAAEVEPERVELLPAQDRWATMEMMAKRLARSPLLPSHIRSGPDPEGNLMVILLAAHDLGVSATVAFQKIHVIEGKPALAAELMRTLIRRDGHDIWSEVERDGQGRPTAVTWFGVRKEQPERVHQARFDLTDATLAGLLSKDVWKKYPEDMLSARATSKLARATFPDCLAGMSYTPEELNVVIPLDEAPPSASIEEAGALQAEIDGMTDEVREIVKARWKEAQIGALKPGAHTRALYASEVNAAWLLLKAAKDDAPQDAEIVVSGAEEDGSGGQQVGNSVAATGVGSFMPAIGDTAPQPSNPVDTGVDLLAAGLGAEVTDAYVGAPVGRYVGLPTETVLLPGDSIPDVETPVERVERGEIPPPGPGQAAGNASSGSKSSPEIHADVKAMSLLDVTTALEEAGMAVDGTPQKLRKRLIDYRLQEPF